jgi:hypothetical protein
MSVFISRPHDRGITGDRLIGQASGLKGCKIRRADLTSAKHFLNRAERAFISMPASVRWFSRNDWRPIKERLRRLSKVERYLFNTIKLPLILILILVGFIMEFLIELPFNFLTRLDARRGPRP